MSESELPRGGSVRPPLASELDLLVPDVESLVVESTAFLVGLNGHQAGKLFKVREGDSVLGRSARSLVVFEEKAVSQRHAQLVHRGGSCVLVDLGSTNGTFVNDRRIEEPVELRAGDVIRVGKTSLGFLTDTADQEQHTRALARAGTASLPIGRSAAAIVPAPVVAPRVVDTGGEEQNGLDAALDRLVLAWGILRRYWKLLAVGALVGAAVGGATVFVRPPKAIAEFRIFLKHHADDAQHQERYGANGGEYFRFPIENFLSPELVRATMGGFDLDTKSPGAVLGTASSLVFVSEDNGMYKGTFYDTDPEFAERFLAAHLQNYLEREIGKSIKVLASEVELLRKQYRENEEQLKLNEAKLQAFKEEHLAGLPEHATSQLGARAALQDRALVLQASLERYTQELALAKRQYASGDALVAGKVDRAQPYEAGLAAVRQKLTAARAKGLTDEHPEVRQLLQEERGLVDLQTRAVSSEATDTERRSNRELQSISDRVGQLEVLASSTKTELDLVQGRLGEIAKIAATMPAVETTFAELARARTANQNLHQHLHDQVKAKELKLDFERASVAGRYELVDPPSASSVSRSKTAMTRAGLGLGAGLGLMVVVAALHWLIDYARQRRRV